MHEQLLFSKALYFLVPTRIREDWRDLAPMAWYRSWEDFDLSDTLHVLLWIKYDKNSKYTIICFKYANHRRSSKIIFFLKESRWSHRRWFRPWQHNWIMSSYSLVAGRMWDLYVAHSVLTGSWLSTINTYNSSLLCAWIVFLCDVVYIMDAIARASKKNSRGSWISSGLFSFNITACGSWTTLTPIISALKFVTFVPYHFLVLLELDITGLYLLFCAIRVARLLQSGRICAPVIWTISKLLEKGRVKAAFMAKTKNCEQSRKANSPKADRLKRTRREMSQFLKYIQKLKRCEMEARDVFIIRPEDRYQRSEGKRLDKQPVFWETEQYSNNKFILQWLNETVRVPVFPSNIFKENANIVQRASHSTDFQQACILCF